MDASKHVYAVNVNPDGDWWMVSIPEIGGLTQARHPGEVEAMARDYIAVALDVSLESFDVAIAGH